MVQTAHQPDTGNRPALRLVDTKTLSRDDWLSLRQHGIGSSDAAAAVGLNPYHSALELWMEKTGRGYREPQDESGNEDSPTYWGTLLEPIVAAHYTKRTGNRVRRINAVLQHPDPKLSWMRANIDREVIGTPEVQILECKTAGINGARLWKDGVPEYVQLQVQHQLAVTGKAVADVAVLLGGQQLEIYRVPRDDTLIQHLITLEQEFWQAVLTETPPKADGTDSAERALRVLYPQDAGTTVDFRWDRERSAAFADWCQVKQSLADLETMEAQLRQSLEQAMGEATRARFETGEVTWKQSKPSLSLDVARLLQDQPELLQRYPRTKAGARRFVKVGT